MSEMYNKIARQPLSPTLREMVGCVGQSNEPIHTREGSLQDELNRLEDTTVKLLSMFGDLSTSLQDISVPSSLMEKSNCTVPPVSSVPVIRRIVSIHDKLYDLGAAIKDLQDRVMVR